MTWARVRRCWRSDPTGGSSSTLLSPCDVAPMTPQFICRFNALHSLSDSIFFRDVRQLRGRAVTRQVEQAYAGAFKRPFEFDRLRAQEAVRNLRDVAVLRAFTQPPLLSTFSSAPSSCAGAPKRPCDPPAALAATLRVSSTTWRTSAAGFGSFSVLRPFDGGPVVEALSSSSVSEIPPPSLKTEGIRMGGAPTESCAREWGGAGAPPRDCRRHNCRCCRW